MPKMEKKVRICFVSSGTLNSFWDSCQQKEADIYCFSFSALQPIDYEKEISGETSQMEDLALFSKEFSCIALCGCYTFAKGIKRKSTVIAEKGKVLGISDMTSVIDKGEYQCGSGVRVYETGIGRIGVVVAEDLYFPEIIKSLTTCGSDIIFSFFENIQDTTEQVLIRAHSFTNGIEMALCSLGYSAVSDVTGKLSFASALSPCYFIPERKKEYHLVEMRQRGFSKPQELF